MKRFLATLDSPALNNRVRFYVRADDRTAARSIAARYAALAFPWAYGNYKTSRSAALLVVWPGDRRAA